MDEIEELMKNYPADFLCLTEHWLNQAQINNITISGYKLVSNKSRNEGQHGGTALYSQTKIVSEERRDICQLSEDFTLECAAVESRYSDIKCVIVVIYRPPNGDLNRFLCIFERICQIIYNENSRLIIAGDFNIDLLGESKKSESRILKFTKNL